jgi:hypothetical protein
MPKGRKKVSIRGGPSFRGKRAKFDQRMVELASANAGAEAARMKGAVDAAKDVRLQHSSSVYFPP